MQSHDSLPPDCTINAACTSESKKQTQTDTWLGELWEEFQPPAHSLFVCVCVCVCVCASLSTSRPLDLSTSRPLDLDLSVPTQLFDYKEMLDLGLALEKLLKAKAVRSAHAMCLCLWFGD